MMIEMAFAMMKLRMMMMMKLMMRLIMMGSDEVTKIYVCWLV